MSLFLRNLEGVTQKLPALVVECLAPLDPEQGWKFMNCSHGHELGQQASWLLIGCTRVNNQSEARSAS